jgi:hypothetical protein
MKKLLILSLILATLAGCANANYVHTASNTGTTFKMVRPQPGAHHQTDRSAAPLPRAIDQAKLKHAAR